MSFHRCLTMQKIDYYSLDAADVLRELRASLSGLSKEEATLRLIVRDYVYLKAENNV
jgi:hypothetical protein